MYQYRGTDTHRYGRKPRPFDPALCGTNKGLWQHRRDGIPKCAYARKTGTKRAANEPESPCNRCGNYFTQKYN